MGWQEMRDRYIAERDAELYHATDGGKRLSVMRTYPRTPQGDERYAIEAVILGKHGYEPFLQSEQGGHIHVGRLLATGGLSIFAGQRGIRSGGTLSVTFRLRGSEPAAQSSAAAPDIPDQIRRLGELRDTGLLTAEEFEAKKAELLARL